MKRVLALSTIIVLLNAAQVLGAVLPKSVHITGKAKNGAVHFLITDPIGRRLGYDPRTGLSYNEFPGGYYNTETGKDEFGWEAIFNPIKGDYMIEAISSDLAAFTLALSGTDEPYRAQGPGSLVDKRSTSRFLLSAVAEGPKASFTIKRLVSPANLKQDIALLRKMGWIESKNLSKKITKRVDEIEYDIANGWKDIAINQISSLMNEVKAHGAEEIKPEGAEILLEDAKGLIDQLRSQARGQGKGS